MTETFIHDEDLDLNDFTPAMRQFIEVKRRYPETLVLFRMGDFYETFFDDAAKANRLIGITLTMDEPTSKLACGNIASTANVEVSKWTGELPDVSVYREPRIVR